jgi:hypothetical protein
LVDYFRAVDILARFARAGALITFSPSARARRGDPLTPFYGLDEPEKAFAPRADERPKFIALAHRLREHLLANRTAGNTNLLFSF